MIPLIFPFLQFVFYQCTLVSVIGQGGGGATVCFLQCTLVSVIGQGGTGAAACF